MNTHRNTRVPTPRGSTAATDGRRRNPMAAAVRNLGIALDTTARVLFLGRDGVKL